MKTALRPFCHQGRIGFDGLAWDAYVDPITGIGRIVYGNPPFDGKDKGKSSAVMTTLEMGYKAANTVPGFSGTWILPLSPKNQKRWFDKGFKLVFRFPHNTIPFIPHGYWTGDDPYVLPGGGCYKDDYSDVVIIAIDSAPTDTNPAFDWKPTQKKIARWFLNVLPKSKVTKKRLEHTGVSSDIWEEVIKERDELLPSSLCPWPTRDPPRQYDTVSYYGGHHDTTVIDTNSKPFRNAVRWPKVLTLMGYLPPSYSTVLGAIGVPCRKIKPLLKKLSRVCRQHTKIRRDMFLFNTLNTSNTDPHTIKIPSDEAMTEIEAVQQSNEFLQNLLQ